MLKFKWSLRLATSINAAALFAGAFLTIAFAPRADADASCNKLFDKAREVAVTSRQTGSGWQRLTPYFLWTTNYFVPERDTRMTGVARVSLNPIFSGGLLTDLYSDNVRRDETHYDKSLWRSVQRKVRVSVRWRADGKMLLGDQTGAVYGPFDPTCTFDKFATITSHDAVEVFALVGEGPWTAFIPDS